MSRCTCLIRVAIAVAVVAGVAEPARAQDRPRVELAGGYQILKLQSEPLDAAGVGTFLPLGWFFEAAAPVSNGLTLVGQVSGQYRSVTAPSTSAVPQADEHLKVHSFLAGARIVGRRDDGLTAFFHLLAGETRVGLTQSAAAPVPGILLPLLGVGGATTEFTLQVGGSFDFPLTSRWSGRMTADYLRLFTEGEPTQGVRVAIGWVVPLAR
jgi:hypothetical protein